MGRSVGSRMNAEWVLRYWTPLVKRVLESRERPVKLTIAECETAIMMAVEWAGLTNISPEAEQGKIRVAIESLRSGEAEIEGRKVQCDLGRWAHFCDEWDEMFIDESCQEFGGCECYPHDAEAKAAQERINSKKKKRRMRWIG